MKKASIILIVITLIACAFTGGFFLGRTANRSDVVLQQPETTERTTPSAATEATESGLLDINTATAAELATLPGIGQVLGQRIVDYRQENGPFTDVGQLTNVEDIGDKRLEDILDLITVGGAE